MKIQIIILAFFFINLVLIWLSERFKWSRLLGVFFFVAIPLLGVVFEQPRFELDYFWWKIAGLVAIASGSALNIWASKELKTKQWKSFDPPIFINTGPYQFLRQPLLLSLMFIFVGWWWLWAAVYSFYFGMIILALIWVQGYLEEKLILEKKYGEPYKAYRQSTGMFWIK